MALLDGVGFTTTTTGTGTITVAAGITDATNSDLLTPAQAGAVDGTPYSYIIVNGHNREEGSGVTGSSGTTLTRDAAAKSWNGTTLGTGPLTLAGTSKVYFVVRGADIPGPSALHLAASADFLDAALTANAASTSAGAAGRFELVPFIPASDITIDQIGINVTTGVASATAKIGFYTALSTGLPGTLVVESSDLDCSTTGAKTLSYSYTFRKGSVYWLFTRHSSTATLAAIAVTALRMVNLLSTAGSPAASLRKTFTYATAAPSPFGSVATADWSVLAPSRCFLRVA